MNLRILTTYLLLSSACVWGAGDVPSVEKDGLKVEIKFVEKEVALTRPLAVEMTLTNTSDKDMRLLGIRGIRLSVYSADGRTYMEAANLNGATTTGLYLPTIKAGESTVEIRKIKLDNLREHGLRGKNILSRALRVVQLEPGNYKVGMNPYFNSVSRDPNDPEYKDLYVGSPGLVQISFTLKEAK